MPILEILGTYYLVLNLMNPSGPTNVYLLIIFELIPKKDSLTLCNTEHIILVLYHATIILVLQQAAGKRQLKNILREFQNCTIKC